METGIAVSSQLSLFTSPRKFCRCMYVCMFACTAIANIYIYMRMAWQVDLCFDCSIANPSYSFGTKFSSQVVCFVGRAYAYTVYVIILLVQYYERVVLSLYARARRCWAGLFSAFGALNRPAFCGLECAEAREVEDGKMDVAF